MDNENVGTVQNQEIVQLPETQIVIGEQGADFKPVNGDMVVKVTSSMRVAESGQDRPTLPADTDFRDDKPNELKSLTDKAAVCIMRQVQEAIESGNLDKLDRLIKVAMQILDAQMAMDWAEKWSVSILERPQNLSNNKAHGKLTALTQGRAMKSRKQLAGDGRTTAKRLLKDLPTDDAA